MLPRLIRIMVGLVLALTGLTMAGSTTPSQASTVSDAAPAAHKDKNCSDFPNQAAAQRWFLNHGGPQQDPAGLDTDHDGIACESNPCPCSHDTGGGGGGGGGGGPEPNPIVKDDARVIRVLDGDTVKVKITGGKKEIVEIIGLNAPRVRGQCGGLRSRDALTSQLPRGSRVRLTSDRKVPLRGSSGRLLRYVEKGGRDSGRFQIYRGWARVDGNKFKRSKSYDRAEHEARRTDSGVWGIC